MASDADDTPPNEWERPYRGYRLSVDSEKNVWWQVYNGTERLFLNPIPETIIERLLAVKNTGGRFHVTETGEAITRVEQDDDYREVWLGEFVPGGEFVPERDESASVPVRPNGLSPGDLWPSVYEGARFSFRERDRVWWQNPDTKQRHYLEDPLPMSLARQLNRLKSQGGSFRVTPWGDVITLVPFHPKPETVEEQFGELPAVVRNIIKLRKQEGLEMLPVYLGSIKEYSFNIGDAQSLSDPLSKEEEAELEAWARNLGRTSKTTTEAHRADTADEQSEYDDDPAVWGETTDQKGGDS